MPFNVQAAAAFIRRVVLKFNQETLVVKYNAGEKFKEYQERSNKLQQKFLDLQRKLEKENAGEEAYEQLQQALGHTRREIADNICGIIEWWDLEGDRDELLDGVLASDGEEKFLELLDVIKGRGLPTEERTRMVPIARPEVEDEDEEAEAMRVPVYGSGEIPIDGAWLDALPLPDKFILDMRDKIEESFATGGAGGKAN